MSRFMVYGVAALLAVLHHDFWFWDDRRLVLGGIPIGLAYHIGFSIAAGLVWAAAVKWAWPSEIEAWADETHEDSI